MSGLIKITEDVVEKTFAPKGWYMTVNEYAETYGINKSTLRTKLSRGEIASYFIGGKRLILVNKSEIFDL